MKIVCMVFFSLVLIGCSDISEVKAPCDYEGHFCGQKIHIN